MVVKINHMWVSSGVCHEGTGQFQDINTLLQAVFPYPFQYLDRRKGVDEGRRPHLNGRCARQDELECVLGRRDPADAHHGDLDPKDFVDDFALAALRDAERLAGRAGLPEVQDHDNLA